MTIHTDIEEDKFSILKNELKSYGKLEKYKLKKKETYVLLLYDNDFLKDERLVNIASSNNIMLQLDLFSNESD